LLRALETAQGVKWQHHLKKCDNLSDLTVLRSGSYDTNEVGGGVLLHR
jgi:hypothetical protein